MMTENLNLRLIGVQWEYCPQDRNVDHVLQLGDNWYFTYGHFSHYHGGVSQSNSQKMNQGEENLFSSKRGSLLTFYKVVNHCPVLLRKKAEAATW